MNALDRGRQGSSEYILDNFEKADLLACVLVNRKTGGVLQRLGTTDEIVASDFQHWLRTQNAQGSDVYVGMNSLHPNATRRTKQDVLAIRHLYLDFDAD